MSSCSLYLALGFEHFQQVYSCAMNNTHKEFTKDISLVINQRLNVDGGRPQEVKMGTYLWMIEDNNGFKHAN